MEHRSIFQEFKEFAMKGNMLDLAIGVIIGAAFGQVMTSLVNDIVMPPIALITGGINFSDKVIVLKHATDAAKAITWNYGLFINALVNFLIVAFVIFLIVKQVNRFRKETPKAPVGPTSEEKLLTEIRDLLRAKN